MAFLLEITDLIFFQTFASFLIDFHLQCGLRGEVDLFVAQAVLQILCRKKTKTASACFFHYAEKHPGIQGEPPYKLPLLNFIWLLLMCLEVKKVSFLDRFRVNKNALPLNESVLKVKGDFIY